MYDKNFLYVDEDVSRIRYFFLHDVFYICGEWRKASQRFSNDIFDDTILTLIHIGMMLRRGFLVVGMLLYTCCLYYYVCVYS